MILWITSPENLNLLDFLTEEKQIPIKKFSGEFQLKNLIINDIKNLDVYSHIAIDLSAIRDQDEDIIQTIKAFQMMYSSSLIFYAEDENKRSNLLNRIIEETNCYNIITLNDIKKIQEEIRICISEGMSKEEALKNINKDIEINVPQYTFEENIKIIVAGTMSRVGTTTMAMNMASYLASIGAKVAYTEANSNAHLLQIHSTFFPNIKIENNFFKQGGIDYFFDGNIPAEGYNFNIIDIGILKKKNEKIFEIGDTKILCTGNKPWEVEELNNSLNIIQGIETNVLIPEVKNKNIKKLLKINNPDKMYFIKPSFNFFDNNINSDVWQKILEKHIKQNSL